MKLVPHSLPYWSHSPQESQSIPIRPTRMREANSGELLRLLRKYSPCSRADLVRHSGLTAPTVSAAIAKLKHRGLVHFIGEGSSNGGRPPRMVAFNRRFGFVVAADVGGTSLRLALADLNGAILGRWGRELGSNKSPGTIVDLIAKGTEELRQSQRIASKRMLELAVGAPGVTNVRTGRVVSAPNLGWRDVPLRDMLEERTGVTTTVENDVNLAAMGEGWCGGAQEVKDFVFIAIGTGVGAGIVINGQVLHGAGWSAGEVGYLMVPGVPAEPLSLNRLGALESLIGGRGIERAWAECSSNGTHRLQATEVFDRAAGGDEVAREVLKKTAEYLSLAISNISVVLDVSLVVLGGGIGGHAALHEATVAAQSSNDFARPKVIVSRLSGDAQLQGAIWLALQASEAHGFRRMRLPKMAGSTVEVVA